MGTHQLILTGEHSDFHWDDAELTDDQNNKHRAECLRDGQGTITVNLSGVQNKKRARLTSETSTAAKRPYGRWIS